MATREQALAELYRRGALDDRQREAVEELARRGVLSLGGEDVAPLQNATGETPIAETEQDERGPLDTILSILEPAATIASGIVAEPVAGLAGIAGSIIPGEEGQGARWVEGARRSMTYMPRSQAGMGGLEKVAGVMEPVGEAIEKAERFVGDPAYEAGGPLAGAAAVTILNAIPELLGLKGTRVARMKVAENVLKKINPQEVYDAAGNLSPEALTALGRSGIPESEFRRIVPPPEASDIKKAVKTEAVKVGDAATALVGRERKSARIAEDVNPSEEILAAAREFGLEDQLLPSHYSQNPVYVAVEQGLKSIPASQLSAREKELLATLAQRTDDLILEFGGVIDKADLSDRFRVESKNIVKSLEDQAEKAFGNVKRAVPPKTTVDTGNIISAIMRHADDLGGVEYLSQGERRILRDLAPGKSPTYARLDEIRREIGKGYEGRGMFKDADDAALGRLYGALAEDQKAAAKAAGAGDLYEVANDLIIARKGVEKQLVASLGKDLAGSITAKAGPAVTALQKGDTAKFDKFLENIPESLSSIDKKTIVASALNDAFTQGSRAEKSLSISAFDDFMAGINRHRAAKERLVDVLGPDAMNRLESFHKIIGGVRKAQKEGISTGRVMAVPGMLDEQSGLAARLFGTVGKAAAAEGVTTTAGMPGVGVTGVLIKTLAANRTKRSVAADQLLSSPTFQKIIQRNALKRPSKVQQSIDKKIIERMDAYKRWKDSLDSASLSDLAAVGTIGYLTGEPILGDEE